MTEFTWTFWGAFWSSQRAEKYHELCLLTYPFSIWLFCWRYWLNWAQCEYLSVARCVWWLMQSIDEPRSKPRFMAVTSLEDVQAIRTVAFHPEGNLFVIGANSKTLRVCRFPAIADLRLWWWLCVTRMKLNSVCHLYFNSHIWVEFIHKTFGVLYEFC